VNTTDEIWEGRIADIGKVKEEVEDSFPPAFTEAFIALSPKSYTDTVAPRFSV
jgi:hypothetical protein